MEKISAEINKKIKESELYKSYVFFKNVIEEDSYLMAKRNELECLKKDVCISKDEAIVDKYYELEKEYKSHYAVKEYFAVRDELNCLLKDIADILSLN